jgi:hypothetical protein
MPTCARCGVSPTLSNELTRWLWLDGALHCAACVDLAHAALAPRAAAWAAGLSGVELSTWLDWRAGIHLTAPLRAAIFAERHRRETQPRPLVTAEHGTLIFASASAVRALVGS